MSDHVQVIAVLTAKPGQGDALARLLGGMVGPSRAEPGNLRYDLWRDHAEAARFIIEERYADHAAVEAHQATAHYRQYRAEIGDLAEREVFLLERVDVVGD